MFHEIFLEADSKKLTADRTILFDDYVWNLVS